MNPLVSVVIPCRNEANHIAACVEAIFRSNFDGLEVIVVDGMSEDGTRDILSRLQKIYPALRIVDNPKKLTPYAFNLGVRAATGEFLQIVGSRNILSPDYLGLLSKALKSDSQIGCVGGDYQHVYETVAGKYISWAMESKFGVGGSNYRTQREDTDVDTVGVPMFPRSIFEKVGFFDETLTRNQDDEFSFRLRKAGYRIRYIHQAKVTYVVRGELKKAFWQYYQYGYFKVLVSRKHGGVTTLRQMVPALFLAFVALTPLAVWLDYRLATLWLTILAVYVFTGTVVAAQPRWSLIERLKFFRAVMTLHAGYGIGYWNGILDFVIARRPVRASMNQQTT